MKLNSSMKPSRPYRTNTPKRHPFHYRGLECKSRKSRVTWSNIQICPWSTEWSRAKTNRVLPSEHTDHSKHPLHTREDSTHGHHQMVNTEIRLIIFFAAKDGDALYSQQKQDREEKQDHELLIAKFRLKLKKVGKTTRWFRYDLNQIPYDYTEEVRNRFKGLDLIDKVPDEYGWRFMTLYRRQGEKTPPRKRNAKKQNGCLRRPYKELWRREAKSKG